MGSIIPSYNFQYNMRRLAILALLSVWTCLAQEAPPESVYQNTGKPIRLQFECSQEDLQTFGMVCSQAAPCPVFLELTSVEPVGSGLFLAGNLHNGSATMYSVLLSSVDSGASWREAHPRLQGAGLDKIQFVDFQHGYASGHILGALPRDPFFLLTTDGGKNWRRRPVFSESRVVMIDRFHFETARSGTMIIDLLHPGETGARYELYETMTGGESWMIREVSARPPRAVPPPETPDLRLRPDRATASYVLERQSEQKWHPVASFLIETAQCQATLEALPPEPPMPAEPPEPQEAQAPAEPRAPATPRPAPTLKKQPRP